MRFLLKLLFAPVMAVLAVVSWCLVFVVGLSSGILLAGWLVAKLHVLRYMLRDWIYG